MCDKVLTNTQSIICERGGIARCGVMAVCMENPPHSARLTALDLNGLVYRLVRALDIWSLWNDR